MVDARHAAWMIIGAPAVDSRMLAEAWAALGGAHAATRRVSFTGIGAIPSAFAVTDLAAASIAAAALAVAELAVETTGGESRTIPDVIVDRRLASFWFGSSIRPIGWELPSPWDPVAGDYRARDGWIRLHTNAPHHRIAAERVLGRCPDKAGMAQAVAGWDTTALESAIVQEGGCAAEMRGLQEWATHPQGQAVGQEPLVARIDAVPAGSWRWAPAPERPLADLRVLDMTRVLAGPVATRFLAGYGAEVLRIDPPGWDEPGIVPEVTLGKRCARLDLERAGDRCVFERLLGNADVLVHGYRPGALDGLGYDAAVRRAIAPSLIEVSLDAYGYTGPWAGRRGFDSLVQMSSGIADAGMRWRRAERPVPLPVQALDHATGYLVAAAVVRAVRTRLIDGQATASRLSLARTAELLVTHATTDEMLTLAPEAVEDLSPAPEHGDWGDARRLRPPAAISGAPLVWALPASALGSHLAEWTMAADAVV